MLFVYLLSVLVAQEDPSLPYLRVILRYKTNIFSHLISTQTSQIFIFTILARTSFNEKKMIKNISHVFNFKK